MNDRSFEPRFSICIPNYNYASYIRETVESALNQTYEPYEVIVVDNASTDDSVDVVESIGSDKVRLFTNRYNVGFAPNLQRATERARGEFLILLSSDDVMFPDALEQYRRVLQSQGDRADRTVICSAYDQLDEHGNKKRILYKPRNQLHDLGAPLGDAHDLGLDGSFERRRGTDVLRDALERVSTPAGFLTTAYPRAMWEAVEGYDVGFHQGPDASFLHKLLSLDPDFVYVRSRLFGYRVHSNNQAATMKRQKALKWQLDGYIRCFAYPDAIFEAAGLDRSRWRKRYIDEMCGMESLRAIAEGNRTLGLQLMSFAWATHPDEALRSRPTLTAAGMLALGPLGTWVLRAARRARRATGEPSYNAD